MPGRSLRQRVARIVPALWIAGLVALAGSGASIAAVASSSSPLAPHHLASLSGSWSGSYHGTFSGTFKLQWKQTGSLLHGLITLKPGGTVPITGTVRGTKITFGAVAVGVTYTGSVSGKSMSGHYKTPSGSGNWSARKTS
jgi:hypothetical protein